MPSVGVLSFLDYKVLLKQLRVSVNCLSPGPEGLERGFQRSPLWGMGKEKVGKPPCEVLNHNQTVLPRKGMAGAKTWKIGA